MEIKKTYFKATYNKHTNFGLQDLELILKEQEF